ncbi:MAG: hypothetical protein ABSB33_02480 [Tepidisphaeraceae bacterium]
MNGRRTPPPEVKTELGNYVYLLIDPGTGRPFYVGRGQGNRVLSHLRAEGASPKARKIRGLKKSGNAPVLEILRYGLDKRQASAVEASAIDLLGRETLSNQIRGHDTQHGRRRLEEIVAACSVKPAHIDEPVVLINIPRNFRDGMSAHKLYDFTRAAWKANPKRHRDARYALAVFQRIVREVYKIAAWLPSRSTMRMDSPKKGESNRWEFVGNVAPSEIRNKYINKSVHEYLPLGSRNPIRFIEVGKPRREKQDQVAVIGQ